MCMRDYAIVASRGRWKDNSWVQQYEVNYDGVSNTLTGVQKDNLVLEIAYGIQDVSVSERSQ